MPELITDLSQIPAGFTAGALAIGNFDGVHVGHRRLLGKLTELADQHDGPAVAMTFDPPPHRVLRPDSDLPPPLTTIHRRAELMWAVGVDWLLAYPTSHGLLKLTPQQFFDEVVCGLLNARAIVEGPNFRFGKDRQGDTALLSQMCADRGLTMHVVHAMDAGGTMISSTRIRTLIQDGNIRSANEFLGWDYQIAGVVAAGERRGRELGFPTANLEQIASLIPGHGVYAGYAEVDGLAVDAAIHIGPNPTFSESTAKVEVHLLDWQGNLYERDLRVSFSDKIRDIQKFNNVDELKSQIQSDIEVCRQMRSVQRKCVFRSNEGGGAAFGIPLVAFL